MGPAERAAVDGAVGIDAMWKRRLAKLLAEKYRTVVAMTGATDYVVSADRIVRLTGGDAVGSLVV